MTRARARATLAASCVTHFLHDGFSDIVYVLLPVWAGEFRLTFAQVGLLRTAYSGGMASFQVPAGILAERWGGRGLLAAGAAVPAFGFLIRGRSGGFASLLLFLLLAGLGSGVQHPLSSSIVSKAYEDGPRRVALGTYNFSGDLAKACAPALVARASAVVGWRRAAPAYGAVGLLAALGIFLVLRRLAPGARRDESARRAGRGQGGGGARRHPHRCPHRARHRRGHPRAAAAPSRPGAGPASGAGNRAERDVVRPLPHRRRPRPPRAPRAGLRALLHARGGIRLGGAVLLRPGKRPLGSADDADDHRSPRLHDDPAEPT